MEINGRAIGPGHPVYVIAELSANHGQRFETARELVRQAHLAGADAVKLQTYTAETLTIDCDDPPFRIEGGLWGGQTLYQLYQKGSTPWEWHRPLKEYANELGMDLFSSPFDATAVDFLEDLGVPAYKVASCELTDHPLLRRVAETKRPVILSSGMASEKELEEAVELLRTFGTRQIAILKCTSAYPARKEDANLATIRDFERRFRVVGGLSDHTLGIEVPRLAVGCGAAIIEKHFTLSRDSGGLDDAFSLTPSEFAEMVRAVRESESILGRVTYGGVESEQAVRKHRRSLFVTQEIRKGEPLTSENVRSIRPGDGLHTRHYWEALGQPATCDLKRGTPLRLTHYRGGGT
jgi:N-acetylneuraminate synthase